MPHKKKPFARIAITLPAQDLASADRLASEVDRSRSWVVAEAIRRYAADTQADRRTSGVAPVQSAASRQPGLGDSRQAQLVRDLALTPEQRVREAEETLRLAESRVRSAPHRILAFDRYEDFLDWKRQRDLV